MWRLCIFRHWSSMVITTVLFSMVQLMRQYLSPSHSFFPQSLTEAPFSAPPLPQQNPHCSVLLVCLLRIDGGLLSVTPSTSAGKFVRLIAPQCCERGLPCNAKHLNDRLSATIASGLCYVDTLLQTSASDPLFSALLAYCTHPC